MHQFGTFFVQLFAIYYTGFSRKACQKDIFRDRQHRYQIKFLIDNTDSAFQRIQNAANSCLLSIDRDFAEIGRVQTTQYLHQRGFARTIFANYRVHFSPLYIKTYIIKSLYSRKLFSYSRDFQNRVHLSHSFQHDISSAFDFNCRMQIEFNLLLDQFISPRVRPVLEMT